MPHRFFDDEITAHVIREMLLRLHCHITHGVEQVGIGLQLALERFNVGLFRILAIDPFEKRQDTFFVIIGLTV